MKIIKSFRAESTRKNQPLDTILSQVHTTTSRFFKSVLHTHERRITFSSSSFQITILYAFVTFPINCPIHQTLLDLTNHKLRSSTAFYPDNSSGFVLKHPQSMFFHEGKTFVNFIKF